MAGFGEAVGGLQGGNEEGGGSFIHTCVEEALPVPEGVIRTAEFYTYLPVRHTQIPAAGMRSIDHVVGERIDIADELAGMLVEGNDLDVAGAFP